MKVNFLKLAPNAVIPAKAHPTDAGFDLVATSKSVDYKTGIVTYGTGIALEIPNGYVGYVYSRSSVYKTDLIQSNCVGIIDSGYRGEVLVKFRANIKFDVHVKEPAWYKRLFGAKTTMDIKSGFCANTYEVGEHIAQLIILPRPKVDFEEVQSLTASDRNTGGFGSSGK